MQLHFCFFTAFLSKELLGIFGGFKLFLLTELSKVSLNLKDTVKNGFLFNFAFWCSTFHCFFVSLKMIPQTQVKFFATVFMLLFACSAIGDEITYQFSGTVTSIPPEFSDEFTVGEIYSGEMTLTPQSESDSVSFYAVSNFTSNIGGHYPITASEGTLRIDFRDPGTDTVRLSLGDLTAGEVAGHSAEFFRFNLSYTSNGLSSTELVSQFISGPTFDLSGLRFDTNDLLNIRFELDDFSVVDGLPGDVNLDGIVNFFDITAFVGVLTSSGYQRAADVNCDQVVDFLDIPPFINVLQGG